MNIEEYFEDFMDELRSKAISSGSSKEHVFIESSLERVVDFGDLDNFDILYFEDEIEGAKPFHAFYFDEVFRQLTIAVSLYKEIEPQNLSNLTNTELSAPFKRATNFIKKALEKKPDELAPKKSDLYTFIFDLKNKWPQIKEVKFIFLTNKPLSKRFDHKEKGKIDNRKITFGIWDLKRFFEVETSGTEREDIEIEFKDQPLSCLEASSSDNINSYLVVMPGQLLADIYGQYKSRVLEQNVRSFLQNRSNVNKGIRLTLDQKPDMFFAYNNGITTTAQAADFNQNGEIISLKNLQIVNGGQTTAQVYNASKAKCDLSSVSVQMKLNIIKDPKLMDQIVPDIAKFANSQNPVSQADLFSNHPFHIRMEELSRNTIPPRMEGKGVTERWFYERSRGQYLNEQNDLTPAQKRDYKRYYPKDKMITKTDLALVLNSWDLLPSFVSKGAQANFKKFADKFTHWDEFESEVNSRYFEESVAKTIIFKELRKDVMKQAWYEGFPANIVTYSISWLAFNLENQKLAINFDLIWKKQTCNQELLNILIVIAEDVNAHIMKQRGNPTTYAKNENCWKDIKSNFSPLVFQEESGFLIPIEEAERKKSDGKKERKKTTEVATEIEVLTIHPDCWLEIKRFMGQSLSEMKNNDIEKLRRGELIVDFKARELAKFVTKYKQAGGDVFFKENSNYSIS